MGNEMTARTSVWKGLNRMPYIEDGEMRSMKNLSSDAYPFLTTRKGREEHLMLAYGPGVAGETYYKDVNGLPEPIADEYIGEIVKNLSDEKFYVCEWNEETKKYEWNETTEPLSEKKLPFKEYLSEKNITLNEICEIGQLNGQIAILFEDSTGKIQLYYNQNLFEVTSVSKTPGKKLQTMGNKLIVGEGGSYLYKDATTNEIKLFPSGKEVAKTVTVEGVNFAFDKRKECTVDIVKGGESEIVLVSKAGKSGGFDIIYKGLVPESADGTKAFGVDFKLEINGKEFYLETVEGCEYEEKKVLWHNNVTDYTVYIDRLTIKAKGAIEDYYWESKSTKKTDITFSSTTSFLPDTVAWKKRLWGYKDNYVQGTVQDVFDYGGQIDWTTGKNTYTEAIAQPIWQGGDITGLAALRDALILFKEDSLTVFTGNYPAIMQGSTISCRGLLPENRESVAVANETVYYLAEDGVYRFSGGIPQLISGQAKIKGTDAIGASDGRKYWLSVKEEDGNYAMYVYDIGIGVWHKEDNTEAVSFTMMGSKMYMATNTQVFCLDAPQKDVEWEAELWYDEGTFNRKKYKKLEIRGNIGECEVYLKADDGEWVLGTVSEDKLSVRFEPFWCRELGVKFKGKGVCEIKSLDRMYEVV